MSHPCFVTKSIDEDSKMEGPKHEHHHTMASDLRSKSGNHHSTVVYYDLILQQDAKDASNHHLYQKSLQRSRKFRSKREDDGVWGYHHFLYTVKEEEEGEAEEQVSLSHSYNHASLQSHGHTSHGSLQRSNNSKSGYVSIGDCYDLVIKSEEKAGGAFGGMQRHIYSRSTEGKIEDGSERSRSKTSLSHGDSDGSLQRSSNSKSSYVSIADCYDLVIKSKEKGGGAFGGTRQHIYSRSKEGKVEDGLERSRSKTSLSQGMYSQGGGRGGKGISIPFKTNPPSMKKITKSRLAYNGTTSCYSLLFLCLLRPLKRLRDQYIKCCFSLAGAGGDLSVLVGEGHVVGPLFHEWFPQE